MIKVIAVLDKYVFTFENFISIIVMGMAFFIVKLDADINMLKRQAISHGFAKYDETKGNWRWVNEEDMHK